MFEAEDLDDVTHNEPSIPELVRGCGLSLLGSRLPGHRANEFSIETWSPASQADRPDAPPHPEPVAGGSNVGPTCHIDQPTLAGHSDPIWGTPIVYRHHPG